MNKKKLGVLVTTAFITASLSIPVHAADGDIYDTSTNPPISHGSIGSIILKDKTTLFKMITSMSNYGYEVSGQIYNVSDVNNEFNKNPSQTVAQLQADVKANHIAISNVPSTTGGAITDNNTVPSDTSQNIRGNTTWNISNGGLVAQSGGWIYYSNSSDGGKLYKINTDGTNKTKLADEDGGFINVIGDWVYYVRDSSYPKYDVGIYKIKTDGSQKIKIPTNPLGLDDCPSMINIVGDWIYYTIAGESGNHYIYKMRLDGTQNTRILNGTFIFDFFVTNDYIFYSTFDGTYRMGLDGTQNTKVLDNQILGIMDDWIYYCNNTSGGLYKIKIDGTNNIKITDGYIDSCNIVGDYIYYSGGDTSDYYKSIDKWKLYKIKIDGTNKTELTNDNTDAINVGDNWIYYYNMKDKNWYRIKNDGTERQLVN